MAAVRTLTHQEAQIVLGAARSTVADRAFASRGEGAYRLYRAVADLYDWFTAQHCRAVLVVGWSQTHKLKVTGDAHRDRLVAARCNLRGE